MPRVLGQHQEAAQSLPYTHPPSSTVSFTQPPSPQRGGVSGMSDCKGTGIRECDTLHDATRSGQDQQGLPGKIRRSPPITPKQDQAQPPPGPWWSQGESKGAKKPRGQGEPAAHGDELCLARLAREGERDKKQDCQQQGFPSGPHAQACQFLYVSLRGLAVTV